MENNCYINQYGQETTQLIRSYKNQKMKLTRTLADIKFLKNCKENGVYPSFIMRNFRISIFNSRSLKAAETFKKQWLKNEIRAKYNKLDQINRTLYYLHREINVKIKDFKQDAWNNYRNLIEEKCEIISFQKEKTHNKKLEILLQRYKQHVTKELPNNINENQLNIVKNLTNETLTNEQIEFLNMGLKHRYLPN